MKKGSILLFVMCSATLVGQVIKSNSAKITIRDGNELKKDYWNISPSTRPDIYETISSSKTHKVTFITDLDSISFDVKQIMILKIALLLFLQ